jgi:hypothetical protein
MMATANQKAKASTIATRKLLRQDRMAGFKATGSALDAIYGNLSTTQAGIGRSQTIANQKTMAALARLAGKTDRATGRIVHGSEAKAANQYGSVIGAAVDRQSGTLEAHAAAAGMALHGEVAAGKTGARGATNVLAITKAGAKAAAAGAAGQLADALQYRAKNDAQIVAQMEQARMEANLQFQTWKRQQDYLKKQEEKDTRGALGGITQATNTSATASAFMRNWLAENPGASAPEAMAAYTEKYGAVEAAVPLLTLISQNVYSSVDPETGQTRAGYTREDETHDLVSALHTLYPTFADQKKAVFRTIDSALAAGYTADLASQLERQQAAAAVASYYQPKPGETPEETSRRAAEELARESASQAVGTFSIGLPS